jgi:hypothetical protein
MKKAPVFTGAWRVLTRSKWGQKRLIMSLFLGRVSFSSRRKSRRNDQKIASGRAGAGTGDNVQKRFFTLAEAPVRAKQVHRRETMPEKNELLWSFWSVNRRSTTKRGRHSGNRASRCINRRTATKRRCHRGDRASRCVNRRTATKRRRHRGDRASRCVNRGAATKRRRHRGNRASRCVNRRAPTKSGCDGGYLCLTFENYTGSQH